MGIKIIITGDDLTKDKKRSLILLNHRTRLDWMFIWMVHSRFEILEQLKIVLKAQLKRLPGAGKILLYFINYIYIQVGRCNMLLIYFLIVIGKKINKPSKILVDTTNPVKFLYRYVFKYFNLIYSIYFKEISFSLLDFYSLNRNNKQICLI